MAAVQRGAAGMSLALVVAATCVAADDGERLTGLLDAMSSYRADFEQTVASGHGEILQTTTGTLHLARPGRLRWRVDEPYPQLIVADGEQVWIHDPDLEQVTVHPFEETVKGTPAMFLTDTSMLRDNFLVVMESSAGASAGRFVLSPLDPDASSLFRSITLTFSVDGLLSRLDIVDDLDQRTATVFRRGRLNPVLESGLFEFEVPAGVDVIGSVPDVPVEGAP